MLRLNGYPIEITEFPNKEARIKDFDGIVSRGFNLLELKYEDDRDITRLILVKKVLDELNALCDLFIWYMPYSRMDRKIEGDVFTLPLVCGIINNLDFDSVTVMEPHSAKTAQLLNRVHAIFPVTEWAHMVMKELNWQEGDHIVFPDKGACARYHDNKFTNVLTFEKNRDPHTGNIIGIILKEGTVTPGSQCLVIDDLCSKGGTFMGVGKILKEKGAGRVTLLTAHCEPTVFAGPLLNDESPIDVLYTSNSMMETQHPKIKYIKLEVSKYVR